MKTIISLCICIMILACIFPVTAIAEEPYHVKAVVIAWEKVFDDVKLFDCIDEYGNVWACYGDDDLTIGDVLNLTMFDLADESEVLDYEVIGFYDVYDLIDYFRNIDI